MDAGLRDKRVTIRRSVTASDGRGGSSLAWVDVDPRWWVSIDPLSAREFLQSGALQNNGTHVVRGLYRGDVTIKHRLHWPLYDVVFEIVSFRVMTTPAKILELECVEADS